MADFGSEYSSNYAYFIAGGSTLAAIKKYESDKENAKALLEAIGKEYGAINIFGYSSGAHMIFDKKINDPAFTLDEKKDHKGPTYTYQVDYNSPEGQALLERIGDIPQMDWSQKTFAKRLTGKEELPTNPDNLQEGGYSSNNGHFREKGTATAATFTKYGDTYVVSVPLVVRGVFNEASKAASIKDHYNQAAGYNYEWWTPPDSKQIPYSKVIELQEQQKGDQLAQRSVARPVAAFSRER